MAKATGIVRRLDELGRVVIPAGLRRALGIEKGDPIEIYVDAERVVLKKYEPGCVFCGVAEGIIGGVAEKKICGECFRKLTRSLH